MRCLVAALVVWPAVLAFRPAALGAQEVGVRSRLAARGLPAELVREVAAVADDAAARGLPGAAVADKAIEGWAKHVPAERILSAVQQYAGRLGEAYAALGRSGLAEPGAEIVVAAAEAMGRGLGAADVGAVVRAARAPAAIAPGLTVAAALTAQGLAAGAAVGVVVDAMHRGRTVNQLLDIPSMAQAMRSEGLDPGEIGKRMIRGDEPGTGRGAIPGATPGGETGVHRPPGLPPGVPGQGEQQPPAGHRPPGGE
jgi:hypothetical protein